MSDTQDHIIQEKPLAHNSSAAAGQVDLIGLSRQELEQSVIRFGLPKFRAKQIWHWLYHRGARSLEEMTTLSLRVRDKLAGDCFIGRPSIVNEQLSEDNTRKWLLAIPGGGEVETVFDQFRIAGQDAGGRSRHADHGGAGHGDAGRRQCRCRLDRCAGTFAGCSGRRIAAVSQTHRGHCKQQGRCDHQGAHGASPFGCQPDITLPDQS